MANKDKNVAIDIAETDTKVSPEMAEALKQYEPIKQYIELINDNVSQLQKLRDKDRSAASEKKRKVIMSQVDKIMAETHEAFANSKRAFDAIRVENSDLKLKKGSTKAQVRLNLYNTYVRRFQTAVDEFKETSQELENGFKDRSKRMLQLVDTKLSDEDAMQIVESGSAEKVLAVALISEDLQDAIVSLQERHTEIVKLERQVNEVAELFRDLAQLIDLQQDSLDVIDHHISSAKNNVEKAETELRSAEKYQLKSRKCQCYILAVVVIILLVILLPVLLTQLGNT